MTSDTKVSLIFMPDSFVIQDINNKKMIGRVDRLDGLYVLDSTKCGLFSTDSNSNSCLFVNNVTAKI